MKKIWGFYRTFFQTLNPASYEGFAESKMKNTFGYFANMVFQALIILILISIPALISLPNELETKLNSVDTFAVTNDFTTNAPLSFPEKNPIFVVNYGNATPPAANIILDHDILYYGVLFGSYQKNISGYGSVLEHKNDITNFVALILVLMAPTVLLIVYFYLLVKYFIVAFLAAIVAQVIAGVIRRKISFGKLFNTAMYGISLSIFLDLIFFAIGFRFYGIQYLPLAFYLFMSLYQNGDKIHGKNKNKYIMIKA